MCSFISEFLKFAANFMRLHTDKYSCSLYVTFLTMHTLKEKSTQNDLQFTDSYESLYFFGGLGPSWKCQIVL